MDHRSDLVAFGNMAYDGEGLPIGPLRDVRTGGGVWADAADGLIHRWSSKLGEPDILNLTRRQAYEIKPASKALKAAAQLYVRYLLPLNATEYVRAKLAAPGRPSYDLAQRLLRALDPRHRPACRHPHHPISTMDSGNMAQDHDWDRARSPSCYFLTGVWYWCGYQFLGNLLPDSEWKASPPDPRDQRRETATQRHGRDAGGLRRGRRAGSSGQVQCRPSNCLPATVRMGRRRSAVAHRAIRQPLAGDPADPCRSGSAVAARSAVATRPRAIGVALARSTDSRTLLLIEAILARGGVRPLNERLATDWRDTRLVIAGEIEHASGSTLPLGRRTPSERTVRPCLGMGLGIVVGTQVPSAG